jgi:Uma2 family endonuclease
MKAVMPALTPDIQSVRQRSGADKWDEMWNGVLHMPAMPNFDHQNLEGDLASYLRVRWARPLGAKVLQQINVALPGGWPDDYRIPDILLLTPSRFEINRNEYFEGAPDAVIEIRSPDDETFDKMSFYAELGVPEVWVIHRDTKEPEIHLLRRSGYRKQRRQSNGWVQSPLTKVEMRATNTKRLAIRIDGDETTLEELPVD